MELSPPDIAGAKGGLITIVLALLFFNLFVLLVEAIGWHTFLGQYWQYLKLETYAVYINSFLGVLGALFVYSVIISGLNFVLSFLGLSTFSLIRGRGMFNPFW
jgi:hypothetical protein